jgi:hypothetical protein
MTEPTSGRETLVERLRDRSDHYIPDWARRTMDEAADALDAVQAEIARLTNLLNAVAESRDAAEDRLASMNAPLAAGADVVERATKIINDNTYSAGGTVSGQELAARALAAASLLRQPEAAPEEWQPLTKDCDAYKGGEVLLTDEDEGFIVQGFWDADEYDEFRGEYRYAWNYGPAEIDGSNWSPAKWKPLTSAPAPASGQELETVRNERDTLVKAALLFTGSHSARGFDRHILMEALTATKLALSATGGAK